MDIYSLLQGIIPPDEKWLQSTKFTENQLSTLENETDKKIFALLRDISSLGLHSETSEIKFSPMFELSDGTSTFSIEDLSDDDFQLLYSLEFDKLPLLLQARIAAILWIKKRDYKMALKASNCYFELYIAFFDPEKWEVCYRL